ASGRCEGMGMPTVVTTGVKACGSGSSSAQASASCEAAAGTGPGGGVTEPVTSRDGNPRPAVRASGPELDEQPERARLAERRAATTGKRTRTRTGNKDRGHCSGPSRAFGSAPFGKANGRLPKKTESYLNGMHIMAHRRDTGRPGLQSGRIFAGKPPHAVVAA